MNIDNPIWCMSARRLIRQNCRRLLTVLALLSLSEAAAAQTVVPNDAKPTCTVSAVEFANWFTSGTVTANSAIDPANSVTFSNIPNCDFYKWSEQMFLWLTSPVPAKYGGGTHVFNSPVFFDVSPLDANGQRTFIPHPPGRIRDFFASIPQRGPKLKPVVFDQQGRMFNLIRPERAPNGTPLLLDKANRSIEVERTQITPDGRAAFVTKGGRTIDLEVLRKGDVRLLDQSRKALNFSNARFVLNGKPFFVLNSNTAVAFEEGQADGNALMAQNNSLVFYALQANDVFAYLRTGEQNGGITPAPTHFPTTPADLNKVTGFALAHSKTLPDADALAVELKSSWIEATGLANPSDYVTITANIPTYDTSNPAHWIENGTKQAQLALVGMHVVGSTNGHPEMIWATFEHVNNAPSGPYTYTTTANVSKTVPQNTAGTWLFTQNGSAGPFNVARFGPNGTDLVAISGQTVGPSNVLRVNAWGSTAASSVTNTDVISINTSVISQLAAGDVRKHYIMTGSTWTIGGAAPSAGNQVGTNKMANSTMETFFQPSNCFNCHSTNQFPVSHIYGTLKPLFP